MLSRGHAFDATKFFPASAARAHAVRTTEGAPGTISDAASPVRRATRLDDAARSGAPRPVREGGRDLTTLEIDPSTDEISLAVDDEEVSMLSTTREP